MTKKIRMVTQGIFLLIFLWLFLQTESKGANDLGYPVKIFLDADPLIFLTTILSSREWYQTFYLAILVIVATVFLGRVFCGWVCPLGTLNNIVGSMKKGRPRTADRKLVSVQVLYPDLSLGVVTFLFAAYRNCRPDIAVDQVVFAGSLSVGELCDERHF